MMAPYTAKDVAALIGITVDTFYKTRERLRLVEGMPAPLKATGKMTWDRASIDAWRTRHHPARPQAAAANDPAPPLLPGNTEEWNDFLHRHYAKERA